MVNQCIGCGVELPEGNQLCAACINYAENGMVMRALEQLEQAMINIKNARGLLTLVKKENL